jgi:outer membrane protein assembly factor BamB
VALLGLDGGTMWKHQAGSPVRCVALAGEEGSWLCAVGTAAGEVQALDAADGQVRWTYKCEPFHGRSGSVGTVFSADLDGQGPHELVAGSDNSHYHALSATGELLWRTETVHASTVGCAGDLDGDGRDDIIAGTEYYWPRLLDPTGKLMQRMSGGPVTTAVGAFDVDDDGKAEAFVGMDDGFLRCVSAAKSTIWQANVGASPTAVRAFYADGDGKAEVACSSESFSVYLLAGDGSEVWRTQLPEAVNDLAVVGSHLGAACEDGAIYLLDRQGTVVGMREFGRAPTCVTTLQDNHMGVAAGDAVALLSAVPLR